MAESECSAGTAQKPKRKRRPAELTTCGLWADRPSWMETDKHSHGECVTVVGVGTLPFLSMQGISWVLRNSGFVEHLNRCSGA